ncbi:MAG: hypothetical protein V1725_08075 [archaeon]
MAEKKKPQELTDIVWKSAGNVSKEDTKNLLQLSDLDYTDDQIYKQPETKGKDGKVTKGKNIDTRVNDAYGKHLVTAEANGFMVKDPKKYKQDDARVRAALEDALLALAAEGDDKAKKFAKTYKEWAEGGKFTSDQQALSVLQGLAKEIGIEEEEYQRLFTGISSGKKRQYRAAIKRAAEVAKQGIAEKPGDLAVQEAVLKYGETDVAAMFLKGAKDKTGWVPEDDRMANYAFSTARARNGYKQAQNAQEQLQGWKKYTEPAPKADYK